MMLFFALIVPTLSFNLPGSAPTEYKESDPVDLKVSKLTSDVAQVPYEYFYLNFCPPKNPNEVVATMDENLGQILMGDAVVSASYDMRMKRDESCRIVCDRPMTNVDFARFANLIEGEYVINWLVDGLPATTKSTTKAANGEIGEDVRVSGFPLGYKQGDSYYINNHARFTIQYHESPDLAKGFRVVGVDVEPSSLSDNIASANSQGTCMDALNAASPMMITRDTPSVIFSYEVKWERSNIAWASRWDSYLKIKDNKIHWFSIVNSLVVVFLLTGLIALVLIRTLHRDISKYNSVIMDEESSALDDISEDFGWKLVHGDVFRKPRHSKLLAVFVGSGVHILAMVIVYLILAVLGLLSPANRGSYLQALLLLFTFMGSIAGYVSARIYKMFRGEDWRTTTLLAGLVFPGVAFSIFFGLNLLLWYYGSSAAVPFSAMTVLLVLWVGISVPLVFVGAYRGYSKPAVEFPVRVHHIPRQIPRQPWYANTFMVSLLGGILPFGAVSTELVFLMGSIWHQQFYYLFGFLFIVLLLLIVTCAEISMAMTYFQLTGEDYRWWWRSFLSSAFSGVYVFIYSIVYLVTKLRVIGFVPTAIYLGYMGLAAFAFFLLTGSIGAIASFMFVRAIYSSIKID